MLLAKNGRSKKNNENPALQELLSEKLEEYGIGMFGRFEKDNIVFRGVRLFDGFPVENEPILKQLYGYDGFVAHIQLKGFDDFATAFDYNVDTGECELQRHSWGTVTDRIKYTTFINMMTDISKRGHEKIFNHD